MSRQENLYVVLKVGRTASINEIRKAFKKLARRYHPDVNPGDRLAEERFKRISEAYVILSDPLKRQFYDENGFYTDGVLDSPTQKQTAWGFSFQGFDFSRPGQSAFGEVFSQFFSRQAMRRGPERGQDLDYPVSLAFEDSIHGLKARIEIFRKQECADCDGRGQLHEAPNCETCGGTGRTTRMKGHLQFSVVCTECQGSGRNIVACSECSGEGRVSRPETLSVQIPAGVTTGSRVRIPSKGDAGRLGGPAGDLYVVTNVAPHSFFKRVGDNIHCTVPITVTEAALGAKIEVPTIDGRAVVRIPPGTQSSQCFRLRGKGAPSLLQPGLRGDQYVAVQLIVPRIADERSKEILRELGRLNPDNPRKELFEDGHR